MKPWGGPRSSLFHRIVAEALVASIFFGIVAVPLAEASVWEERRQAVRGRDGDGPRNYPQLAQLPTVQSGIFSGVSPAVSPSQSPIQQGPALPKDFQVQTLASQATSRLPSWAQNLPLAYASFRRAEIPPGWKPGDRLVLHLQDAHLNPAAQKNIAAAVQHFIDQGRLELVALEGAFGRLDVEGFRGFKDRLSVRKVADRLFKDGKISGAVHTAFTSAAKIPPFIGVDDSAHYDANVNAYRQSYSRSAALKENLDNVRKAMDQRKASVFNTELRIFDGKIGEFNNADLTLGEYLSFVAATAPRVPQSLRLFIRAYEMEKELDFIQVEKDRAELLKKLSLGLSPMDLDGLVTASLAYRLGRVSGGDFYAYLKALCQRSGTSLAGYPAMRKYLEYVLVAESIHAETLFEDMVRTEEAEYARLSRTPEEKALVRQSRAAGLMAKLVQFSLSPQEWREYLALALEVEAIKNAALAGGAALDLASFETFFREAVERDAAMAENLIKAMDAENSRTAILVTGGFHSSGIEARLKREGVAVLTLSPKIGKVDLKDASAYLSAFAREKTPLDKLFAGEKLFVSPLVLSPPTVRDGAALLSASQELANGAKTDLDDAEDNAAFQSAARSAGKDFEVEVEDSESGVTVTVNGPQAAIRYDLDSDLQVVEGSTKIPFWSRIASLFKKLSPAADAIERRAGSFGPAIEQALKAAAISAGIVFTGAILGIFIPTLGNFYTDMGRSFSENPNLSLQLGGIFALLALWISNNLPPISGQKLSALAVSSKGKSVELGNRSLMSSGDTGESEEKKSQPDPSDPDPSKDGDRNSMESFNEFDPGEFIGFEEEFPEFLTLLFIKLISHFQTGSRVYVTLAALASLSVGMDLTFALPAVFCFVGISALGATVFTPDRNPPSFGEISNPLSPDERSDLLAEQNGALDIAKLLLHEYSRQSLWISPIFVAVATVLGILGFPLGEMDWLWPFGLSIAIGAGVSGYKTIGAKRPRAKDEQVMRDTMPVKYYRMKLADKKWGVWRGQRFRAIEALEVLYKTSRDLEIEQILREESEHDELVVRGYAREALVTCGLIESDLHLLFLPKSEERWILRALYRHGIFKIAEWAKLPDWEKQRISALETHSRYHILNKAVRDFNAAQGVPGEERGPSWPQAFNLNGLIFNASDALRLFPEISEHLFNDGNWGVGGDSSERVRLLFVLGMLPKSLVGSVLLDETYSQDREVVDIAFGLLAYWNDLDRTSIENLESSLREWVSGSRQRAEEVIQANPEEAGMTVEESRALPLKALLALPPARPHILDILGLTRTPQLVRDLSELNVLPVREPQREPHVDGEFREIILDENSDEGLALMRDLAGEFGVFGMRDAYKFRVGPLVETFGLIGLALATPFIPSQYRREIWRNWKSIGSLTLWIGYRGPPAFIALALLLAGPDAATASEFVSKLVLLSTLPLAFASTLKLFVDRHSDERKLSAFVESVLDGVVILAALGSQNPLWLLGLLIVHPAWNMFIAPLWNASPLSRIYEFHPAMMGHDSGSSSENPLELKEILLRVRWPAVYQYVNPRIEILEDIQDDALDRETLLLSPSAPEQPARIRVVLTTIDRSMNLYALDADALDRGVYDDSAILAYAWLKETDGAYESHWTTTAGRKGEGLMQRTIALLLLRGKVKEWRSSRKPEEYGRTLSPPAAEMYERFRQDRRFNLVGPIKWGWDEVAYTITVDSSRSLIDTHALARGIRARWTVNGERRDAHVRAFYPDSTLIVNVLKSAAQRNRLGQRVVPQIFSVYVPRLRLDMDAAMATGQVGYRRKTELELPAETLRVLEAGQTAGMFELIYLDALEDYQKLARDLRADEDTLIGGLTQTNQILLVSDWIGPNVEDFLEAHLELNEENLRVMRRVGQGLGETLRALHGANLIAGDTHLGQFVVDEESLDVSRVDLVNTQSVGDPGVGEENIRIEWAGVFTALSRYPQAQTAFENAYPDPSGAEPETDGSAILPSLRDQFGSFGYSKIYEDWVGPLVEEFGVVGLALGFFWIPRQYHRTVLKNFFKIAGLTLFFGYAGTPILLTLQLISMGGTHPLSYSSDFLQLMAIILIFRGLFVLGHPKKSLKSAFTVSVYIVLAIAVSSMTHAYLPLALIPFIHPAWNKWIAPWLRMSPAILGGSGEEDADAREQKFRQAEAALWRGQMLFHLHIVKSEPDPEKVRQAVGAIRELVQDFIVEYDVSGVEPPADILLPLMEKVRAESQPARKADMLASLAIIAPLSPEVEEMQLSAIENWAADPVPAASAFSNLMSAMAERYFNSGDVRADAFGRALAAGMEAVLSDAATPALQAEVFATLSTLWEEIPKSPYAERIRESVSSHFDAILRLSLEGDPTSAMHANYLLFELGLIEKSAWSALESTLVEQQAMPPLRSSLNGEGLSLLAAQIAASPLPIQLLQRYFESGARVIFVNFDPLSVNGAALWADLIYLSATPEAPTHLALSIPANQRANLIRLMEDESFPHDEDAWVEFSQHLPSWMAFDPALSRELLNFLMETGIEVVLYGAEPEVKGEAALSLESGRLRRLLTDHPNSRIIVHSPSIVGNAGRRQNLFRSDALNSRGFGEPSLAAAVAAPPLSVSILQESALRWQYASEAWDHNLGEYLAARMPQESFGLPVGGSMLEGLYFDPSLSLTYGEAWDAVIFYARREEGPDPEAASPPAGAMKVPGISNALDEDALPGKIVRLFQDPELQAARLTAQAIGQDPELNLAVGAGYMQTPLRGMPMDMDLNRVRLAIVEDEANGGIPMPGANANAVRNQIPALGVREGDGLLIYVTRRFYNDLQSYRDQGTPDGIRTWQVGWAEIVDHEWQEQMEGRTHRQAASRSRYFAVAFDQNLWSLSFYHYWILDRLSRSLEIEDIRLFNEMMVENRDAAPDESVQAYEARFLAALHWFVALQIGRDPEVDSFTRAGWALEQLQEAQQQWKQNDNPSFPRLHLQKAEMLLDQNAPLSAREELENAIRIWESNSGESFSRSLDVWLRNPSRFIKPGLDREFIHRLLTALARSYRDRPEESRRYLDASFALWRYVNPDALSRTLAEIHDIVDPLRWTDQQIIYDDLSTFHVQSDLLARVSSIREAIPSIATREQAEALLYSARQMEVNGLLWTFGSHANAASTLASSLQRVNEELPGLVAATHGANDDAWVRDYLKNVTEISIHLHEVRNEIGRFFGDFARLSAMSSHEAESALEGRASLEEMVQLIGVLRLRLKRTAAQVMELSALVQGVRSQIDFLKEMRRPSHLEMGRSVGFLYDRIRPGSPLKRITAVWISALAEHGVLYFFSSILLGSDLQFPLNIAAAAAWVAAWSLFMVWDHRNVYDAALEGPRPSTAGERRGIFRHFFLTGMFPVLIWSVIETAAVSLPSSVAIPPIGIGVFLAPGTILILELFLELSGLLFTAWAMMVGLLLHVSDNEYVWNSKSGIYKTGVAARKIMNGFSFPLTVEPAIQKEAAARRAPVYGELAKELVSANVRLRR